MNDKSAKRIRAKIKSGEWEGTTVGRAGRHVQAGFVALPKALAYDFLVFCQRNPKPCPLLEVTDPGCPTLKRVAPGADVRDEIGRYSIWRRGELVEETSDIKEHWGDDTVGFLLGSSLTFSTALEEAGCASSSGISLYETDIACVPAGVFAGPMVVTMRTLPPDQVARATLVTNRFHATHGAPIHVGEPAVIGITDLSDNLGDFPPPLIPSGHVPVFWSCSVTAEAVAKAARIDLMITHSSGHGFVTDLLDCDLAER